MRLVLGVTGSIAASLIPGWVVYLRQVREWDVQVVLSDAATTFVSPVSLEVVSGHPVHVGDDWIGTGDSIHKGLTEEADVMAVSPCTVNTFAKLAAGICDGAVTATAAFARCPVVLFPAFGHEDVGRLAERLRRDAAEAGYHISGAQVPARETHDGSTKAEQGFPTIDVFERELAQVLGTHAAA